MRRVIVVLVLLALAAPASAAQPAWKGLINDWYDGHIDHAWPCSAYRQAIRHLPESGDTYSTAKKDLEQKLRSGDCAKKVAVAGGLWIGPRTAHHTTWWPYAAGALALLSAVAVGLRRARQSTREATRA